jgi:hypothetical protein
MSHLALPRLHFRGEFEANVPTANNDTVADVVDVARVAVDAQGKTDDELRQWLEAYQEPGPNQTEGIRAGWNYYGDNSCRFRRVTVTRVDLPTGSLRPRPTTRSSGRPCAWAGPSWSISIPRAS